MTQWFYSYLDGRTQTVIVNGCKSNPFKASSGVAQGSRLGPLLFAAYINDRAQVINFSNFAMFADDCRLSMKIVNPQDASKLQSDITNVASWLAANKLQINESKCLKITFSRLSNIFDFTYKINNIIIPEADVVRDLGIILDKKWSFDEQIRSITARSFRSLGFIKRITTHFSDPKTIAYLFKSLVLPGMIYGSIIWSPHHKKDFDRLNSIITSFLRYLSYKSMSIEYHNYKELSIECKLFTMESVHKMYDMLFVYDNLSDKVNTPGFSEYFKKCNETYNLRWLRPYEEKILKKDYLLNAPIHRLIRSWNNMLSNTRGQPKNEEKLTKDRCVLRSELLEHFVDPD